MRVSELVVEQPAIAELDINPLLATPERLIALDARVILHDRSVPDGASRPAIRPYRCATSVAGRRPTEEAFLDPSHPAEDESLIVAFHRTLSAETVYQRYFANLGTTSASRTTGWCACASPTTTARSRSSPSTRTRRAGR